MTVQQVMSALFNAIVCRQRVAEPMRHYLRHLSNRRLTMISRYQRKARINKSPLLAQIEK
jgi:hypothetical protein